MFSDYDDALFDAAYETMTDEEKQRFNESEKERAIRLGGCFVPPNLLSSPNVTKDRTLLKKLLSMRELIVGIKHHMQFNNKDNESHLKK